jgi:hypothetical protein
VIRSGRLPGLALAAVLPALAAVTARPAGAAPELRASRPAGPLTVYPDDRRSALFYYPPGDLALATGAEGRPDLHLLEMRYTGNVAGGDQGKAVFRSLLSFKVRMAGPTPEELRKAAAALTAAGTRRPELRPLPIRRLDTALVYTAAGAPAAAERPLPEGHFEASGKESGGTWSERIYSLALDPATADLFWQALRAGQIVLSVGYAFYADGLGPDRPLAELTGTPALVAELRRRLAAPPGAGEEGPAPAEPAPVLVRAGAVAITVDAGRWPDLLRRVDVNESVPPGYAALDLYCYDFRDALRPGLYEKQVEIEAQAVGGGRAMLTTLFRRAQPELYARSLRFPVAVRLDRPYRYRVIETFDDGRTVASPWTDRGSWTELLDVTSQETTP